MTPRQLYRALLNKRKALIAQRMEWFNVDEDVALRILNYQYNRSIPWAYIELRDPKDTNTWHRFEVRGFRLVEDPNGITLNISAVNWTIMAGTCSIRMDKTFAHEFRLLPY